MGSLIRLTHPPQISPIVKVSRKMRYIATTTITPTNATITRGMLLNHLLFGVNNTTTAYRLLTAIRVSRIELWDTSASTGGVSTVSIQWTSNMGPCEPVTDTSIGSTVPAHIVSSPPKTSLARNWSTQGSFETEPLFVLTGSSELIVDVTLDMCYQGQTNFGPVSVTMTNIAGAGVSYVNYLSGPAYGVLSPVNTVFQIY